MKTSKSPYELNYKESPIIDTKSIVDYYNSRSSIEKYGYAIDKVRLWKSEEIFLSKYISKNSKILDLGCGAGRIAINLFRNGYINITGVDIADNLIKFAKNYCKKNRLDIIFQIGDATHLKFLDSMFDIVIFSYNGLQSIPGEKNRKKCLGEIYRILNPNGIFLFTAHDRDDSKHQQYWIEEKKRWDNGIQDKHLEVFGDRFSLDKTGKIAFCHFSNIGEMEKLLRQNNFQILEYARRETLADESEIVKDFSSETIFWACRKVGS